MEALGGSGVAEGNKCTPAEAGSDRSSEDRAIESERGCSL